MKINPVFIQSFNPKTIKKAGKSPQKTGKSPLSVLNALTLASSAYLIHNNIQKNNIKTSNQEHENFIIKFVPNTPSKNEIENKLQTCGYLKDNDNNFKKVFSQNEHNFLEEKYGNFANDFENSISKTISQKDIDIFKDLIASHKSGKVLHKKNFEKFFQIFCILNNNDCLTNINKRNEEIYKCIKNIIKNDFINKDSLESLMIYKQDTYSGIGNQLQKALINKSNDGNFKIDENIQNHINNISSVINKCKLPKNMELYRVEKPTTVNLAHAQLKDSTINLGKIITDAALSNDPKKIEKIQNFIADNEIYTIYPRFMSTSLNNNINDIFGKKVIEGVRVLWDLKTEPSTKGLYIEGINPNGQCSEQNEVLLQKNSKIIITNAHYDKENKIWLLNAKVSN